MPGLGGAHGLDALVILGGLFVLTIVGGIVLGLLAGWLPTPALAGVKPPLRAFLFGWAGTTGLPVAFVVLLELSRYARGSSIPFVEFLSVLLQLGAFAAALGLPVGGLCALVVALRKKR